MGKGKKIFVFILIIVILTLSGLAYAVKAKNIKNLNDIEAIEESDEEKGTSESVSAQEQSELAEEVSASVATVDSENTDNEKKNEYPLHKNVSTTFFWVGEEAGKDNKNISNLPSAWDENWVKHFGGIDDPKNRKGFNPAGFTPRENPFYFALPYNDFDKKGKQKNDKVALVMWSKDKKSNANQSICKNQWIKITKNGKSAYAQWEDVGPFGEDDKNYVFGNSSPKSKENNNAGLDVSPAVKDYLGLKDIDKTDWQFVDADDVPDGPWKKIITTSQVYWK